MTLISAVSLSTSSWRPAFSYCSIESRRCLTSDCSNFCMSSSVSSEPFSIWRFIMAALTMRSVDVRFASCAFIAAVRSETICLLRLIFQLQSVQSVAVRFRQILTQKSPRVRLGNVHYLLGRARADNVATGVATFGAEIDDVIRGLDDVEIMFDHQQ